VRRAGRLRWLAGHQPGLGHARPGTGHDLRWLGQLPREEVLELYAAESIAAYWIANIPDRQIEVYTAPSGPAVSAGYGVCTIFRPGDEAPIVLDGLEVGRIAVDEVFPDQEPGV